VGIGSAPIALGTDTGGSIRIPASSNGIFGYRPSINSWPSDFGMKLCNLKDSIGPLALSIRDIQLLDRLVTGQNYEATKISPSSIRIGVPTTYFYDDMDPLVQLASENLLKLLSDSGF
jgi:Asp-tRNA(Asn)/Glu-tRNA(Gln) amidotransferase A subunit family amidase